MMRRAAWGALLLATAPLTPAHAAKKVSLTGCKPLGMAMPEFEALKASGWAFGDKARRDAFLLALADCTGATDPSYRDLLAFEATQILVRKGNVEAPTLLRLSDLYEKQLTEPDPSGVRQPFAALNLAEIVRADRVAPYLPAERRKTLLDASTGYMRAITDYRGFDPKVGYRHAVAHAADLLMQWSLNSALDKAELIDIRDAVGSQAAPLTTSYITGESERLARPIFFIAQRGLLSAEEWSAWFAGLAEPGPLQSWDNHHLNPAAIARRHNAQAFLMAVYVNASASENAAYKPLAAASLEALKKLP